MSTPAVGQIIDGGNVDEFTLPDGAIVVDSGEFAWQHFDGDGWYLVGTPAPYRSVHLLIGSYGPVEVAWLPPADPTPVTTALQEALERRAA